MSWHSFRFSTSQFGEKEANNLSLGIKELVDIDTSGDAKDVAIYSKLAYDGSHHIYYFSPKASELASPLLISFNAEPCERPSPDKSREYSALQFKGGDETFWTRSNLSADEDG